MLLRGSRLMGMDADPRRLAYRNLKAFRARLSLPSRSRALSKFSCRIGIRVSIRIAMRIGALEWGGRGFIELQSGLEIGDRGAMPADPVGVEAAGYFALPFRLHGQITLRGGGD